MTLDLLEVISRGYNRTMHRIYKMNSSWQIYKKYMAILEEEELITNDKVTPLGYVLLRAWRVIRLQFPYKWLQEEEITA